MGVDLLDLEIRALAQSCPRCYYVRAALKTRARALIYDGLPCIQAPIRTAARALLANAGPTCTCGLNLGYEDKDS